MKHPSRVSASPAIGSTATDGAQRHQQPTTIKETTATMTDQTPGPDATSQETADEIYNSIYGAAQQPELSPDDQDFYSQLFPTN
jgi:hypothetical protein